MILHATFHGTAVEAEALLLAIKNHCSCQTRPFGMAPARVCAVHRIYTEDQYVLNHVVEARRWWAVRAPRAAQRVIPGG